MILSFIFHPIQFFQFPQDVVYLRVTMKNAEGDWKNHKQLYGSNYSATLASKAEYLKTKEEYSKAKRVYWDSLLD